MTREQLDALFDKVKIQEKKFKIHLKNKNYILVLIDKNTSITFTLETIQCLYTTG